MVKNYTRSHARIWCKLLGVFLAFAGFYALFQAINNYSFNLTDAHILMGLLSAIVLPAFCIFIWIAAIKIDMKGISQIYGFKFKNGKFIGWIFEYKWKELEIRLWSTWPNPTIAIDKSRVPKIWWILNSHYWDSMRMIAKYGKDRMMNEETRQYFSKFEGE